MHDDRPDIFRVATVPPPAGESDPYSAKTRVGDVPPAAMLVAMGLTPMVPANDVPERAPRWMTTLTLVCAGIAIAGMILLALMP